MIAFSLPLWLNFTRLPDRCNAALGGVGGNYCLDRCRFVSVLHKCLWLRRDLLQLELFICGLAVACVLQLCRNKSLAGNRDMLLID